MVKLMAFPRDKLRGWREILQEVNWKLIEKLGGLKTKVDDEKLESVLCVYLAKTLIIGTLKDK